MNRQQVIGKIKKHKYIFFGEIHGTKEIPKTTLELLKNIKGKNVLCLELYEQVEKSLLAYIKGQKNYFLDSQYTKGPISDKRITENTIKMYKELYKMSFKLMYLEDYNSKKIKERDKNMANKFTEIVRNNKFDKYFIYIGNLHLIEKQYNFGIFKIGSIKPYLPEDIRKDALTILYFKGKEEKISFNQKLNRINFTVPIDS